MEEIKMTKEIMGSYYWLDHEIKRQEKRRDRLACSRRMNETETDVVSGSSHQFPYIETKFKISGAPTGLITKLEEDIEKSIKEALFARDKIAKYIDSRVADPKLREILRSRFIDCLQWEDVGRQNYISKDHARKMVRQFMNKLN